MAPVSYTHLDVYKRQITDYPQAYANYAHEISLPIYPQLTNEMADIVVDAVIKAYDHVVLNHQ